MNKTPPIQSSMSHPIDLLESWAARSTLRSWELRGPIGVLLPKNDPHRVRLWLMLHDSNGRTYEAFGDTLDDLVFQLRMELSK
jgi:hypothetical protein